ncbi:MAG: antitoxin ParD1/3/4 [Bradymonadia bacterium]|jgi:antitoxin ParD1/3/4
MRIELPPELEGLVESKVADGTYETTHAVVRAALILLAEREQADSARQERLREWAVAGFRDLDEGRISTLSVDDIKRTARERFLK